MDYSNIVNAVSKLSAEQRSENYRVFSKLMDDGVYLPDLIRKAENGNDDRELFSAMEQEVRDNPRIKNIRSSLLDVRNRVILDICMKDAEYCKLRDEYRRAVNEEYLKSKRNTE